MYQVKVRVLKNEEVARGYFRLFLESPGVAKNAVPGQFVMVKVGGTNDPLLRRPFSIHRILDSGIEILYKVIGKGTGMMASIKAGEEINIIGPLGKGFNLNVNFKKAIIVGGGIGIAPLVGLAETLAIQGKTITVYIGGKSKEDILCEDDFRKIGADVHIATDDGSAGRRGFVTDYLLDREPFAQTLKFTKLKNEVGEMLFICGPHAMTKKIAEAAIENFVPCQVSLEAHMACGVGACLGCVIRVQSSEFGVRSKTDLELNSRLPTPNSQLSCGCDSNFVPCDTQFPETSYKRACMEGPVFDAEEVVWD